MSYVYDNCLLFQSTQYKLAIWYTSKWRTHWRWRSSTQTDYYVYQRSCV